MVERLDLDAVFHALAHPARRDMLDRLTAGEMTVGALADPQRMSLAAASKHVKVLERAGLIERTIEGREHRCALRAGALAPAGAWLHRYEAYWTHRLDSLAALLEEPGGA